MAEVASPASGSTSRILGGHFSVVVSLSENVLVGAFWVSSPPPPSCALLFRCSLGLLWAGFGLALGLTLQSLLAGAASQLHPLPSEWLTHAKAHPSPTKPKQIQTKPNQTQTKPKPSPKPSPNQAQTKPKPVKPRQETKARNQALADPYGIFRADPRLPLDASCFSLLCFFLVALVVFSNTAKQCRTDAAHMPR